MKRFLLTTATIIFAAPSARAGIPVTCVSCPTAVQDMIQHGETIAQWGKQIGQGAQQIAQGKQMIDQGTAMYRQVTGVRDLGSAVGVLQSVGIQNPLPVNPWAVQGLLNGTGNAQGMLGSLSSLYTGTGNANTIYAPTLQSWVGQQIKQTGAGIAGTQATQLQLYKSAADRAPEILNLQQRIASATDQATRESLIAQLNAVQAGVANQQIQATAVASYGQQQIALKEQQQTEYLQKQIDAQLAEGRAKGWIQ